MQTTDYNIPVFNNEDVADLNEYSNQMASALKTQLNRFGNPLTFKGNVATFADLPTEAIGGWIYNVTDENKNYVYSGTEWVIYSKNFDTGNLATLNNLEELQENIDTSKLDKMVVAKVLNTAGWYRVAKYNSTGAVAKSFLMNINTVYSNTNNISATIAVNIVNTKAKLTNLSALTNANTISKVRITQENNISYLEIYYNASVNNAVKIDFLNQNDWNLYELNNTDITMLDFETPTDTATVLDELSITNTEGTWTPTIENATVTYDARRGNYKKIGNIVFINFWIRGKITAVNSDSGEAKISGLPFNAIQTTRYMSPMNIGSLYDATSDETYNVIQTNEKELYIRKNYGSNAVNWKTTSSNYFDIAGNGFYFTND